jgi:branched-chain amino acid transport system permease protein
MMTQITIVQAAILAANSFALGGLLFLLSSGFSLIFGLMRIPNLLHGSFFMLGAYFGVTLLARGVNFWIAALASGIAMAIIGGSIERFLLRRLGGQELPQVLLTLGFAFIIGDVCLMIWTGDPWQPATPAHLAGAVQVTGLFFPIFRLVVLGAAVIIAVALWFMVDWTRLGAMIRAGVDDAPIARVVGIKVSQLFTLIFALGAALAAFAGVMGAPILSVYPGLDADMLPLALIVVILGGTGSLLGALVGSFIIGALYNFGPALFPELAYVVLFLPMLLVLVLRPQGLFGRQSL